MSATNGNGNGTNGNGNGKRGSLPQVSDPVADLAPIEGFPASEKVYVEADDVRVPVRRVHLTGGEAPGVSCASCEVARGPARSSRHEHQSAPGPAPSSSR
jgi:hypothetical protein